MPGETYCRRCGYIGKREEFQLPFGERGAGSGGACPACRVLVAFMSKEPLPREKLYRQQLHAYKAGTCSRCGIRLKPFIELSGDRWKGVHRLDECDACLEMEVHYEGDA